MTREQELVQEFHLKFNRAIGRAPGENFSNDPGSRRLRAALVLEEACEFVTACGYDPVELLEEMPSVLAAQRGGVSSKHAVQQNLVDAVDALADLQYVTLGAAVTFGVDLEWVFGLVHNANMQKEGGTIRDDGKILKPPGWRAPDVAGELEHQKRLASGAK